VKYSNESCDVNGYSKPAKDSVTAAEAQTVDSSGSFQVGKYSGTCYQISILKADGSHQTTTYNGKQDYDHYILAGTTGVKITLPAADATGYWDINKGGSKLEIIDPGTGVQNVPANWNDQLSSMNLTNTAKQITLYEHGGGVGKYLTLPAGSYNLTDFWFNDQVSSYKVIYDPYPKGVVMYNDINGDLSSNVRTISQTKATNQPSVPAGWNDQVSYLYVPYCSKVTIYEHSNYEGTSKEFTTGVYNLTGVSLRSGVSWNDQLSSYKLVTDTTKSGC
jgi:hypothetical protein